MGVLAAVLRFSGINFVNDAWFESHSAEVIALIMLIVICIYLVWDSMRADKLEKK